MSMQAATSISCCLCGVTIEYNKAAMCLVCLDKEVDITEGFPLQHEMIQCSLCEKIKVQENQWFMYETESNQLLSYLIKRCRLESHRFKLLDAAFVWTEPHSKRVKIALNVSKEVLDEKIALTSRIIVEFKVVNKQCVDCIRESTDHTFGAMIQLRQRSTNKKTWDLIEKLLIEKAVFNLILDIKFPGNDGMDLFFKKKNQSEMVTDLLTSAWPCIKKHSKKLISKDRHTGAAKMEYSTYIEIAPVHKDDLVFLQPQYTGTGRSDLMLISKLSTNIHLVHPSSRVNITIEVSASKYFNKPFQVLFSSKDLIRFVVLDINPVVEAAGEKTDATDQKSPTRYEAEVAKESDFDSTFLVVTHVFNLQPGDVALGYFLADSTLEALDELSFDAPDVVLVKKTSETDKKKGGAIRKKKKKKKSSRKTVENTILAAQDDEEVDGKDDEEVEEESEDDGSVGREDEEEEFATNAIEEA